MSHVAVIRPATPDDTEAIVIVCTRAARLAYVHLVTGDYLDRVINHFYNSERVRREIAPGPGWFGFMVALGSSGVVGVAGTGRSAQHPDACELFTLYVEPAAQRQGVGRALVDQAVDAASASGARQLDVAVLPGNTPAVRFYEACGFTFASEREIYAPHGKEGGPDRAQVYRKEIGQSFLTQGVDGRHSRRAQRRKP